MRSYFIWRKVRKVREKIRRHIAFEARFALYKRAVVVPGHPVADRLMVAYICGLVALFLYCVVAHLLYRAPVLVNPYLG